MLLATPSAMATQSFLASRQKSSLPELRIVISDDNSKTSPVHVDSGYVSALSPLPQEPLPISGQASSCSTTSLSARSPVSPQDTLSIFTNPEPFGNDAHSPPTPSIALPMGSRKNVKKLSLTSLDPRPISPTPSTLSLRSVVPNNVPTSLPPSPHYPHRKLSLNPHPRLAPVPNATGSEVPVRRRSSVMSLPVTSSSKAGRRQIEDDAEGNPYENGPVEIIPGVWLGAEENAQDWANLTDNNIGAILNVAKEVSLPFDREAPQRISGGDGEPQTKHFVQDDATGRPALTYLHLPWSHGQSDLVKHGFVDGMAFIDKYLAQNIGVLIHCQCGISRSATLAIAYVMRSAQAPDPPPQISALKKGGMQSAYSFVKAKSQLVGPNMSLIYQLLEYERFLSPAAHAPSETSGRSEEEEWTRQRLAMDDDDGDKQCSEESGSNQTRLETAEARELDQRMIERRDQMQRYPSRSSITSSGIPDNGMQWKGRFGNPTTRPRGLSVGSDRTSGGSLVSDSLLEVNEESEYDETEYDEESGHSRKSSVEIEAVDTYVQLPSIDRSAPSPIILPPILPPPRKQSGVVARTPQTAFKTGSFLDNSSYASSVSSRRTSVTSLSSVPADKTTFFPTPSTSASQSSFVVPFPRRRSPSPNFGPPSSRSSLQASNLHTVLDSVPSSPDRSGEESSASAPVKKRPPPVGLRLPIPQQEMSPKIEVFQKLDKIQFRPPDRKARPAPLQIPVSQRQSNYAIVSSSDSSEGSAPSQSSSISSSSLRRGNPDNRMNWSRRRAPLYPPPSTSTTIVGSATPHQTLFLFPASPTRSESMINSVGGSIPAPPAPSTMLLTTTMNPISPMSSKGSTRAISTSSLSSDASSITTRSSTSRRRVTALPSGVTPTLAAFRSSINGAGLRKGDWSGMPSTPTTATAHVEVRGWVMGVGRATNIDTPLPPLADPIHSRSRHPH